ncbi:MAG: hypothetical protein FWE45_02660 [Firmicutes bacterium]|nr:hypothetical protein [Bacillota bacterium]
MKKQIAISVGGGYQLAGDKRIDNLEGAFFDQGVQPTFIKPKYKTFADLHTITQEFDVAAARNKFLWLFDDPNNELANETTRPTSPNERQQAILNTLLIAQFHGITDLGVATPLAFGSREHRYHKEDPENKANSYDAILSLQGYKNNGASKFLNIDHHAFADVLKHKDGVLSNLDMYDLSSIHAMLLEYLKNCEYRINARNTITIAPDNGALGRNTILSNLLNIGCEGLLKTREIGTNKIKEQYVSEEAKRAINGNHVLVFDDIFGTCNTIGTTLMESILPYDPLSVTMFGTHTVLDNGGPEKLTQLSNHDRVNGIYYTNATYVDPKILGQPKLHQVDMSQTIANGIIAATTGDRELSSHSKKNKQMKSETVYIYRLTTFQ